MKSTLHVSKSHVSYVPAISTFGLLFALAGCTTAPTRLATVEADSSPALDAPGDGDSEAPVPVHQEQPQFPFEMRRAGIEGNALVKIRIDKNGVVREAVAVQSSNRAFEQAALEAVKQWTFKPATQDGLAVEKWATIPMVFTFSPD